MAGDAEADKFLTAVVEKMFELKGKDTEVEEAIRWSSNSLRPRGRPKGSKRTKSQTILGSRKVLKLSTKTIIPVFR